MAKTWIETFSGRQVDLISPVASQITIDDIAHHLSRINRFNGATTHPYSVAQHSIYVSMMLPDELALQGLLHDAHEAYLGDLNTPLKNAICCDMIPAIVNRLDRAIYESLGIDQPSPEARLLIKRADLQAMADEKAFLKPHSQSLWEEYGLPPPAGKISVVLTYDEAKQTFLNRFRRFYDRTPRLQANS